MFNEVAKICFPRPLKPEPFHVDFVKAKTEHENAPCRAFDLIDGLPKNLLSIPHFVMHNPYARGGDLSSPGTRVSTQ